MTVSGVEEQPSLAEMGLEEVEPGIIEDTFENRLRLRSVGYKWTQVLEDDGDGGQGLGHNVPLIRPIDTAEQRRFSLDKLERKAEILEDPEDAWSEYQDPLELLADAPVPFWVRASVVKWKALAKTGVDPSERGHWLAKRCNVIKRDGTRCWFWSGASRAQMESGMCRAHLNVVSGAHSDSYVKSARDKILSAAPAAADLLEHLATHGEQESVRLKAAVEILDRAGIKGGTEVTGEITVTHVDAAAAVRERLEKLQAGVAAIEATKREIELEDERRADIVEAEIVE